MTIIITVIVVVITNNSRYRCKNCQISPSTVDFILVTTNEIN